MITFKEHAEIVEAIKHYLENNYAFNDDIANYITNTIHECIDKIVQDEKESIFTLRKDLEEWSKYFDRMSFEYNTRMNDIKSQLSAQAVGLQNVYGAFHDAINSEFVNKYANEQRMQQEQMRSMRIYIDDMKKYMEKYKRKIRIIDDESKV